MNDDDITRRLEQLESRINELECELADERDRREELETEVESLKSKNKGLKKGLDVLGKSLKSRIYELQAHELEKGKHLLSKNILAEEIEISEGRLEQFTKDDGREYYRIPGRDDFSRGGDIAPAHDDLLQIQQLARLDDDMLASKKRPVQIAVKLWQARSENRSVWSKGCGKVREYVDAGELAQEIRVWEDGVGKVYAQKLATRTMDELVNLTQSRVYKEMKNRRKNGRPYQETRLILPSDADIPGETISTSPQTNGVGGEA